MYMYSDRTGNPFRDQQVADCLWLFGPFARPDLCNGRARQRSVHCCVAASERSSGHGAWRMKGSRLEVVLKRRDYRGVRHWKTEDMGHTDSERTVANLCGSRSALNSSRSLVSRAGIRRKAVEERT